MENLTFLGEKCFHSPLQERMVTYFQNTFQKDTIIIVP